MTFDSFITRLDTLKSSPLPGLMAHQKLIPPSRKLVEPQNFLNQNPKIAGVMALIYPVDNLATIVFTQRHVYKGVHSAQISFPGGKKDAVDGSTWDTAKREAFEEVCVDTTACNLIRPLTPVYIPPSNFYVEPYLAFATERPAFKPQESEVKEIIEMPLQRFLELEALHAYEVPKHPGVYTPAFKIDDHVIWGATAMMVSEIIHHIFQPKF